MTSFQLGTDTIEFTHEGGTLMNRARLRIPILAVAIAAIVAVIVATSGASTKKRQLTVAGGSTISLRQTSVGRTLVDANGRTLYLFQADQPNVSKLSSAGRAVWPPFTSMVKPQASAGINPAQVGTVTGGTQVTYSGHPLYYYLGDHRPGQALGQGLNEFGARWYALSAGGAAITSTATAAPSSAASSNPTTGGPGYGY
jgi:predicted lipoprotein with Yx(FWY)xxD motif